MKFEFLRSKFSTSKTFSGPAFFFMSLQTGFSIFLVSCLDVFHLVKSDLPLKGDLLVLLISGPVVPMGPCGLCPHPVTCLGWTMVG